MSLSVGIIGFGQQGQFLLEVCRRVGGIEVRSVYRPDLEACTEAARRYGIRATASYQEILADSAIDAVFVTSPSEAHREHCEAALAAGKHVLVEKPLADTPQDAAAIAAAAAQSDRLLMVDHCERFDPAFLDARHAIATGQVGELRVVHSTRLSPLHLNNPAWQMGVLDTAVHNLDLICWLMDAAPESVSARSAHVNPDLAIDDNVWVSLHFSGGRHAEDHIAWVPMEHYLMPVAHPRFLLLGTRGFYQVDLWRRAGMLYQGQHTRYADDVLLGVSGEYLSTLAYSVWHFARAVARGGPSPVPAADAYRALRVALAARESLAAGGTAVVLKDCTGGT
ncbi:MAG: Gfo/Idh/MocA family oxidoreductase [Planctomycetes bacterium]|nr:Gfo/Idh/MocA family oxidoreductase [Planctomycetota bacterium]